jgi:hypothetical protein
VVRGSIPPAFSNFAVYIGLRAWYAASTNWRATMPVTVTIHNHDSDAQIRVVEIETREDDEDAVSERTFTVAPGGTMKTHLHDHVSLIVEQVD